LTKAFIFARSHSPSERVMVEQYLDGPQISTESVVVGGRCWTPGFSDRNYEYLERYAPFFIENGGDLPSHLAPDLQAKVKDVVARAASALGIVNATVKGDIVVHKGEAYVIELAARLSGGFFCSREIPLNTGVDFVGAAIKLALGEAVDQAELIVTANPGDVIPPAGDKRPSAAMVLATGQTRDGALQAANDALSCLRIQTA
jgi:biotin carboxylase